MKRGFRRFGVAVMGVTMGVGAAVPASAQLFWKSPDFRGTPITGADPNIMIPLPGATEAEINAEVVWTMRAGLNFAALQCSFAPSLMTRENYNALLPQHFKELDANYKLLNGYFKRTARKGTSQSAIGAAFDNFNTRTYSSFSTVFAQLGFCQTASRISQAALNTPKGSLKLLAHERLRELRNSLKPTGDLIYQVPAPVQVVAPDMPALPPSCFDRKGEIKKKCL